MFDFLPAERERAAFRHALRVECQIVRERDFKLVGRRSLDLSSTGMQVVSETDVQLGETLLVSFRAPRTDRFVDAEAVVTRVSRGQRRGDVARSFGLEFSAIDRGSFTLLKTALRRLPATRATRPARLDYAGIARVVSFS
jgi:c-di-GMP-binding flagellar brake protein YcgR